MPDSPLIVRTYVVLTNGDRLFITEPYGDVRARVDAVREAHVHINEEGAMDNPLSLPLVNVRMIVRTDENDEDGQAVVDACFNPMHLVTMFRAHPDV